VARNLLPLQGGQLEVGMEDAKAVPHLLHNDLDRLGFMLAVHLDLDGGLTSKPYEIGRWEVV
jgi:hypothetical protein